MRARQLGQIVGQLAQLGRTRPIEYHRPVGLQGLLHALGQFTPDAFCTPGDPAGDKDLQHHQTEHNEQHAQDDLGAEDLQRFVVHQPPYPQGAALDGSKHWHPDRAALIVLPQHYPLGLEVLGESREIAEGAALTRRQVGQLQIITIVVRPQRPGITPHQPGDIEGDRHQPYRQLPGHAGRNRAEQLEREYTRGIVCLEIDPQRTQHHVADPPRQQ